MTRAKICDTVQSVDIFLSSFSFPEFCPRQADMFLVITVPTPNSRSTR